MEITKEQTGSKGLDVKVVLRYTSLTVLTFQTTATVLALRYSRLKSPDSNHGTPTESQGMYIASTSVLISELVKFGLCFFLLSYQKKFSVKDTCQTFSGEVLLKPFETVKLAIPSTLYTIQNNLLILALTCLDAATYQVTYQLKILATAIFSVLMLRKHLNSSQWAALVFLMLGVALVQYPSVQNSKEICIPSSSNNCSPDSLLQAYYRKLLGLAAVLISCVSSGFAGVFYEKLLKEGSQPSVIIRNLQLGVFSILFAFAGVLVIDWKNVTSKGFFYGYQPIVWVVIALQASGGLLVAATIKYADNILKGFATSISIILSCVYSYIVFQDLDMSPAFLCGALLVIGATFLYGYSPNIPPNAAVHLKASPDHQIIISSHRRNQAYII